MDPKQPDLMGDSKPTAEGWKLDELSGHFQPKPSYDSMNQMQRF